MTSALENDPSREAATAATDQRGQGRWPLWATLTFGAAYLLCLAMTAARGLSLVVSLTLVIGLGIPLTLLLAWGWAGRRPARTKVTVIFLLGGSVWLGSAFAVREGFPWWLGQPVNTAALLVVTFAVGNWLAGELERVGHLLPVCLVAALADVYSALWGPTAKVSAAVVDHMAKADAAAQAGLAPPPPPLTSFLILQWPQPGFGGMAMLVGFGDLVFFGLLLATAHRFGLSARRAVAMVLLGVVAAFALVLLLKRPVPALPTIGLCFLLGFVRELRMPTRDWLITAGAALLLTAGILANVLR